MSEIKGEIREVFSAAMDDSAYLRQLGEAKRFAELWTMVPGFAEAFLAEPQAVLAAHGIGQDPAVLRMLTVAQDARAVEALPEAQRPLLYRRYRAFYREKFEYRTRMLRQDCVPSQPEMKAWRARQVNRAWFELGAKNTSLIHAPLMFELTEGCSVGCPFCGLAAKQLRKVFRYTEENAALWRAVLAASKEIVGPAAGTGTCYYATEPFDNPDYEKFSDDFYRVFQSVPQVTTAASMRDCERTRRFLRQALQAERRVHRFSVLRLETLRQIYAAFSPEELVYVELLPQYPEAPHCLFANAGRARSYERREKVGNGPQASTISCISGFVVNMAERSVRLTTPCAAGAAFPTGERRIARAHFDDAAAYAQLLRQMIADHMRAALPKDRPLVKRDFVSLAPQGDGLAARGAGGFNLLFKDTPELPGAAYQAVARYLNDGLSDAYALAEAAYRDEGIDPAHTFFILQKFFAAGILAEPYEEAGGGT